MSCRLFIKFLKCVGQCVRVYILFRLSQNVFFQLSFFLPCLRCSVFLLDQDSDELVATVFDGITTNNKEVMLLSRCRVFVLHQFLSPAVAHHVPWSVWVHCMCMQYSVWYASFPSLRQSVLQVDSIIHF